MPLIFVCLLNLLLAELYNIQDMQSLAQMHHFAKTFIQDLHVHSEGFYILTAVIVFKPVVRPTIFNCWMVQLKACNSVVEGGGGGVL